MKSQVIRKSRIIDPSIFYEFYQNYIRERIQDSEDSSKSSTQNVQVNAIWLGYDSDANLAAGILTSEPQFFITEVSSPVCTAG